MDIANNFVGKLRAGQADIRSWGQSTLSRVNHDGSTYYYDLPSGTTLADFKSAAEVAFRMDATFARVSPSEGFYRVDFD